ncbi:MAG: hypothetical protein OEZ22_14725 [Spirochaetia bacterium]|nr:hypothetical protein [Spirochaetia bacterium]
MSEKTGEDQYVKNINPYLINSNDFVITKRQKPICSDAQKIIYGNKPSDDGNFIFNEEEKNLFLEKEPKAKKFMKRYIGSKEFIYNLKRWCLWLKDAKPNELKSMPKTLKIIDKVKAFRLKSTAKPTIEAAETPSLFFYISQPSNNYLLIPETSSEKRLIIPIGYISKDIIVSNSAYLIPGANLFSFGLLVSNMHMIWTKTICGRLESRYRYSGSIVYNNFPWPKNPSEKQKQTVEEKAQHVLDVRKEFPDSSLADLYDPLTMPPKLLKAHQALDKAVDKCYRPHPFANEMARIEFLFQLYEEYTNPVKAAEAKTVKKEKKGRLPRK